MREIKFRAKIMQGVANEGQWRYWKLFEEIPDSRDSIGCINSSPMIPHLFWKRSR